MADVPDGARHVDLNADCGEGFDDDGLLRVVTSANVACGAHAGTPATLARVVATAAQRGVAVGAQVSYDDREGFGRRVTEVEGETLRAQVLWQVGGLDGLCRSVGAQVRYVKPHGALYHRVLSRGPQGDAVAAAATSLGLPLLLMPGSAYPAVAEGFADRAYDGDRLRPRTELGAVLDDPDEAARQAVALARHGTRSVCVHGDSPGAVETLRAVRAALEADGWTIAPFA
jgi:UPF0271 protein